MLLEEFFAHLTKVTRRGAVNSDCFIHMHMLTMSRVYHVGVRGYCVERARYTRAMIPFEYAVHPELLPEELQGVLSISKPDRALEAFIRDCEEHPHTPLQMAILSLIEQFVPSYEAHGMLGMYPMHILGPQQWEQMVPTHLRGGSLLDVGAGQGFVTEHARSLFSSITATETARSMVRRLWDRGFAAHPLDITDSPAAFPKESYDVVSVLNVLDRCERPLTLLSNALSFLRHGGLLIISDPLPISQRVRGAHHVVKESIGGNCTIWEESLANLYHNTIVPLGLTPTLVTRLPYIYKSSGREPYVILDDFVLVCKK